MANNLAMDLTDDGFKRMDHSLIYYAERGDIEGAKQAIANNPDCIHDKDDYGLNALQAAICEFHKDMALYLVNETDISTRHKDHFGRDALHLGIQGGSEELCRALDKKWSQERYDEMQAEKNKVTPFTPKSI
ncbi:MAG: ankyrin repeat domain-containing protein [Candidatus Thiodiazotropha sp. (ex Lucinoma kastoroae)]|nr:ankyrin repeat domain-containing protein [Candidatus Thiodiazotropha sp. (ex Lucinoma kastoroae)]